MSHRHLETVCHRGTLAGIAATLLALVFAAVAIAAGTTLTTEKAKPGKILVTSAHRSVYMFSRDSASHSACTGTCAKVWPPLLASGRTMVAARSGLNPKLLGRVRIARGKLQITYNHHPLYLYRADRKAGDIKGEGVHAFGGQWYLVSPAGKAVRPKRSHPTCKTVCQSY